MHESLYDPGKAVETVLDNVEVLSLASFIESTKRVGDQIGCLN